MALYITLNTSKKAVSRFNANCTVYSSWQMTHALFVCVCPCVTGGHARPADLCAYSQHSEQTSSCQRVCGEWWTPDWKRCRQERLEKRSWLLFPCRPSLAPTDPRQGPFRLRPIRWPLRTMQRAGLVLPERRYSAHNQPVRPQLVAGVPGWRRGQPASSGTGTRYFPLSHAPRFSFDLSQTPRWPLLVCSYVLFSSTGKSFQQQREAMKQTIEEDKEPEKTGPLLSSLHHDTMTEWPAQSILYSLSGVQCTAYSLGNNV